MDDKSKNMGYLLQISVIGVNRALCVNKQFGSLENCPAFLRCKFGYVTNAGIFKLSVGVLHGIGPSGDFSCHQSIHARNFGNVEMFGAEGSEAVADLRNYKMAGLGVFKVDEWGGVLGPPWAIPPSCTPSQLPWLPSSCFRIMLLLATERPAGCSSG